MKVRREHIGMDRIPEPELMDGVAQALAYANADFEEAHSRFIAVFDETFPTIEVKGHALDLGCGPGDITFRFARAHSQCIVHGVDGSESMLGCARAVLEKEEALAKQVELILGRFPDAHLPLAQYDAVISNSLLHHLHDPGVLWETVNRYAAPGGPIFIMDLKRPESTEDARRLVETYSGGEPEILKEDFYNSLLAAFEPGEIEKQLEKADLDHLSIREVSDRHVVVSGLK
jgi:ubiquinone/menaquinone biosynthesis C-methylase UbiE